MKNAVEVRLWGTSIGYLGYAPNQTEVATFEYLENFQSSNIEISPVLMPLKRPVHTFPSISQRTFKGLPGIFADSLPDRYGNQMIDLYFSQKGIPADEITTLDRLLYVHNRTIGALSYHPDSMAESIPDQGVLDLKSLSDLSKMVLDRQDEFNRLDDQVSALKFIRVSASAGGARAKALVATNKSKELLDGTRLYEGHDHRYWLLKFDNEGNKDRDGNDPKGMTKVEYIYTEIAKSCGIDVPETQYLEDGDDFHFMIERFDRFYEAKKSTAQTLHYASWCGLSHHDRDTTGTYSYEQLVIMMRRMHLPVHDFEQIFKRAVFNVIGRNQDDHTKNFGFLMNKKGVWSLSPAFDLTYAYNPSGTWTKTHQIRLNGKQTDFVAKDLISLAVHCDINRSKAKDIISDTVDAFSAFNSQAKALSVSDDLRRTIVKNLRLD